VAEGGRYLGVNWPSHRPTAGKHGRFSLLQPSHVRPGPSHFKGAGPHAKPSAGAEGGSEAHPPTLWGPGSVTPLQSAFYRGFFFKLSVTNPLQNRYMPLHAVTKTGGWLVLGDKSKPVLKQGHVYLHPRLSIARPDPSTSMTL
jgi:hypothetical protein